MECPALRRADVFVRGATAKAWTALLERRLPLSPIWWAKALALHWQETRVAATPAGPQPMDRGQLDGSYARWLRSREQTAHAVESASAHQTPAARNGARLSIVALVDGSTTTRQIVESLQTQTAVAWELSLVALDSRAQADALASDACTRDSRISVVWLGDLIRTDGTWLPPGPGDYVVLLGPDTRLAPDALGKVFPATADSAVDWIYTDDDRMDDSGRRVDPYLKGAFSPELALFDDYATRLAVVRRGAAQATGGLRSECREAQVYDLLLRIAARGGTFRHVAEIGCHRRREGVAALGPRHRAAAERVLAGQGVPALIKVGRRQSPSGFDVQDVVWPPEIVAGQHITVLIPTRDKVELLSRCIDSLRRTVDPNRVQVLILDDRSREPETRDYLAMLSSDQNLRCRVIRPASPDDRFNYARLMNIGSREVDTELLLHLNNDIEAVSPGWLDQLSGWLAIAGVGVVGPKLLYPDGSLQHAGVVVSPSHGAPGHLFRGMMGNDAGYQWLPHRVRNVSAVTGACLLTRTNFFHDLGGFDEEHLGVQFNDTDYCLRAIAAGRRVVYEPSAVLVHRESASRGPDYDYRETLFFLDKYRDYQDPFASPRLDIISLYGPTPVVAP